MVNDKAIARHNTNPTSTSARSAWNASSTMGGNDQYSSGKSCFCANMPIETMQTNSSRAAVFMRRSARRRRVTSPVQKATATGEKIARLKASEMAQ